MRAIGRILVFAGAMSMATTATAGPLELSMVGGFGGWHNETQFHPAPGPHPNTINIVNQGGSLVDTVSWGVPNPGDPQSAYLFDPVDGTFLAPLGVPFLLGVFTHQNKLVDYPVLQTVDYLLSFATNGSPASIDHVFSFHHNETPNTNDGAACPAGPEGPSSTPGCDDFVTITNLLFDTIITQGADTYYFNLLGFSKDGGSSFLNVFQSKEFSDNSAGLYAVVTAQPSQVPEPSTLLLLGGGIATAVGRRIARRRAR